MSGWVHPNWKQKSFRDKAFWLVIVILLAGMVWGQFSKDYFIGFSRYAESCIDGGRMMIVNKSTAGTLIEAKKGNLLAFVKDELDEKLGRKVIGAKYVAAVEGDVVVVKDGFIKINGKVWGALDLVDAGVLKEKKSSFDANYVVGKGKVLMLGTTKTSYDGRYWGLIDKSAVVGRAHVVF